MIRMRIANDIGATIQELGSRISAAEYSLRYEALVYQADPAAYRKQYESQHMSAADQVARMKAVLN